MYRWNLSYFSFNGIDGIYRVIGLLEKETGIKPNIYFVLNIFDQRSNFAKALQTDARQRLGQYLLSTKIRSSVRLREAAKLGKTIFEHDEKSAVALDFYNLTSELLTIDDTIMDMSINKFKVFAPKAGSVYVLGDFNGWRKNDTNRLSKFEDGNWTAHINVKKGKYRYKFLVDDEWISDPENPQKVPNIFGSVDSLLEV